VLQDQTNFQRFFEHQRDWVTGFFRRLERSLAPLDPLVAVIRREGMIRGGRYVMFFQVTLFADSPVMLEEFGRVHHMEKVSPPAFGAEIEEELQSYRYFVTLRQYFHAIEDARDYWLANGATAFWDE